ncbi:MAG: tripartite tricarboxylate transporter TctB family protein [Rhodoplanes sp.]|uniref:tripartite tricarboxylate transporter TctB family protein n=1 Tax=Rhodoplanes sp. TaxID=1968906 RepID=UPI001803995E|nr:tripartite tricarboxylate transporter TctB family protein [Rhodoplanes sp.]NVO16439.1 tripartite tricarboxylate transporter TctB family protein [Rhodoplanes sp.]
MRISLTKNVLAGLLFVGFGLFGLWLSHSLDMGTADAMGSGYFPRMVCSLLIVCGGVLAVLALVWPDERPEGWHWRPLVCVTLASLAFALLLRPLGLVAALAVTILLGALSGPLLPPLKLAFLVVVLIAVNVGIFVLALGMPIPLWPALT